MKAYKLWLLLCLLWVSDICFGQDIRKIDNPLFVFNNSFNKRGLDTIPVTEQAALLKQWGYDGMEQRETTGLLEAIDTMRKYGLRIYTDYMNVDIDKDEPYLSSWKEVIPQLKGSDLILWIHFHSKIYKPSDQAADDKIVDIVRELADYAKPYGVRIAIYHHIDFLVETAEDSYRIATKVNRDNVGSVLNLCHYLRTASEDDLIRTLDLTLPKLFVVSINGADSGDTRKMEWPQLIQPLGQGSFDCYRFVEALIDKGYTGPIGVQCYNLKGEPATYLLPTIEAWIDFKRRYEAPLNKLSDVEKREGWELLFDGKSTEKWRGINISSFPKSGWRIADNMLIADLKGGGESADAGDIITKQKYGKFILKWEWNMKTRGGNSGVKYYVQEGIGNNSRYGFGLEYQLLDDKYHEWMLTGKMHPNDYHTVGALYEIYSPSVDKKVNPVGMWNESMIVSDGTCVEHWLNGKLILKYNRSSDDFKAKISASKFQHVSGFGVVDQGHILLQDHGSEICFRNIKIKVIQ